MRRISLGRVTAKLIGAGCVALALASPAVSQASFVSPYTTQCSGSSIEGIGSGPQTGIAKTWSFQFSSADTSSPLSCAGKGPGVEYTTATSLQALEALGATAGERSAEDRLAGVEEPPTLSQWMQIDLGDKPGQDSGLIRQIPVALAAVAPLVSYPQGCAIPAKEATGDGRFKVSNTLLEQAYAGKISTWGQLLPDIQSSCAGLPIKRVVPAEAEGTTFVFKQWLGTIDPALGWPESSSLPNTGWPNDTGATATVRSEGGDSGEAASVAGMSGAIGFASLSQARESGFGDFSPENPLHEFQSGQFWLSVQNGSGKQAEPTRDPKSGADNVQGANCDSPQFNYTPSGYDTTVTPVWRYVSAVGSKTGWPICTLTYDLAWDDASTVYGNTNAEQAKQRTVKDYLAYVVGAPGQAEAKAGDYSPLPAKILADAQDGQSRVGWNKTPAGRHDRIRSQISAAAGNSQP
ncbi:MAG TPA: substrate-binding domain-containing protein [Solirubrobacteraceae bacterium]|jgi:ABC-type phosphate transport system substrate-binding protein